MSNENRKKGTAKHKALKGKFKKGKSIKNDRARCIKEQKEWKTTVKFLTGDKYLSNKMVNPSDTSKTQ